MSTGHFIGRTAIATGSTQGIGEAVLRRLADDGLSGAVVTGRNAERGAEVVADLESRGCEAIFVRADLADATEVVRLAQSAHERFGVIHHLANCAGISDRADMFTTSPDLFDRMMSVNVRAPFLLSVEVARIARDAGSPASIVNVGSMAAHGGAPFITAYSIAKGALMTMTKTLAYQLLEHQIRINTVNPGWMNTPGEDAIQRTYHGATDGWLERAAAQQPFGHLIEPDEVAATLAFLLSDEAGVMTGAIIDYDQTVIGPGDVETA